LIRFVKSDQILAKSKSCIPKSIRSPTAMSEMQRQSNPAYLRSVYTESDRGLAAFAKEWLK